MREDKNLCVGNKNFHQSSSKRLRSKVECFKDATEKIQKSEISCFTRKSVELHCEIEAFPATQNFAQVLRKLSTTLLCKFRREIQSSSDPQIDHLANSGTPCNFPFFVEARVCILKGTIVRALMKRKHKELQIA